MKNKYLIRMEEPEDCQIASDSADVYYRLFLNPVTSSLKNEFDCMQFHTASSKPIDYHEHNGGTETFIVSQGKILCNCMGKDFTMGPGDILHIQPWMGHGFKPVEPESRLNILFMGIDQRYALSEPIFHLWKNFPDMFVDSEFNEIIFNKSEKRALPVPKAVPPEQVYQLRRAGTGINEHEFKGIKLHQKVARYETEGIKEIWELFMEPGFYCEWDNFLPEYRLFYVTDGRIRCTVKTSASDTLEFDAVKENIIVIPPYNPFKFEVVEKATMYDLDCSARLQDLCEEIESLAHNDPESIKDKGAILALCKTCGLNCTDVGIK